MKAASAQEIKNALKALDAKAVTELCLRLARYKKENKELLTFLLFEADDLPAYIKGVNEEIDEVVDIRVGSPTFGKTFLIELSSENKKQLLVPAGFAHGFAVISPTATVLYKCDEFWNKESEGGIRYNDAALNIDWGIPEDKTILLDKDLALPLFAECRNNFVYQP